MNTTTTAIERSNGATGTIEREEFGAKQLARVAETASTAMAAQAQAAVQARYIVAMQRPRDIDDVRVRLLRECARSGFAQVARYSKPMGGTRIEGLSVRFAEAAIRVAGNIAQTSRTTYDDAQKRIVNVSATDLETNATYDKDIVIDKTVERQEPKKGQVVLSARTNAAGKTVYLVQATDDELLTKEAALVSKAFRTLALRLIPGDILEECEQKIVATLRAGVEKDPDAERKRIADAFDAIGVKPSELKAYLGHDLASASPAEILELRSMYVAIKDGDSTWADVVESKNGGAKNDEKAQAGDDEKPKAATSKLADKIKAKAQAAKEEAAKPAPTPAPAAATTPPSPAPATTPAPPPSSDCAVCGNAVDFATKNSEMHDGHAYHPTCREQAERG